jgi:hypothetical protein
MCSMCPGYTHGRESYSEAALISLIEFVMSAPLVRGEGARVTFLEPWERLSSDQAESLNRELATELPLGHPLCQVALRAIARSGRADDALFEMNDGHVVVVHLTWLGACERLPFPLHRVYDSIDQWTREVMLAEHSDSGPR